MRERPREPVPIPGPLLCVVRRDVRIEGEQLECGAVIRVREGAS